MSGSSGLTSFTGLRPANSLNTCSKRGCRQRGVLGAGCWLHALLCMPCMPCMPRRAALPAIRLRNTLAHQQASCKRPPSAPHLLHRLAHHIGQHVEAACSCRSKASSQYTIQSTTCASREAASSSSWRDSAETQHAMHLWFRKPAGADGHGARVRKSWQPGAAGAKSCHNVARLPMTTLSTPTSMLPINPPSALHRRPATEPPQQGRPPTAVRHADHHALHPQLRAAINESLHAGDQRLAALKAEAAAEPISCKGWSGQGEETGGAGCKAGDVPRRAAAKAA